VTESTNALDRDEGACAQTGIPKSIERCHTCTQERSRPGGLQLLRYCYRSAGLDHHDFRVSSVNCDSGKDRIDAIDEVTAEATEAGIVPTSTDSDAHTLTYGTGFYVRAYGVDSPDDLVARHTGIDKVWKRPIYEKTVRMTHAASLDSDAHLIGTGLIQWPVNLSKDSGVAYFYRSVRSVHLSSQRRQNPLVTVRNIS
jgi:hypothetical protein